jgi:hypothetical protein
MRFDLRLDGRTAEGRRCVAHVSVYADSLESLQRQAHEAGTTGPWYRDDDPTTLIPDNSAIVVERVEQLNRGDNG